LGAAGLAVSLVPAPAEANHPVLVEGNNAANGGPGTTVVPPGTGGDHDGDGLVGTAEDFDNSTDRVFGTLNAALGAVNGGASNNGHILIVTSGRFAEQLTITPNRVVIIEAAPGVQATIDAVLAGDAGSAARQAGAGITINPAATPDHRRVVLRNLVVRNFHVGVFAAGAARVTLENCRFDSNLAANIMAGGAARLTVAHCSVSAGGVRLGSGVGNDPAPGYGIAVVEGASALICHTTITGNAAAGIFSNTSGQVRVKDNCLLDNAPDVSGRVRKDKN
jgi:hypothetical protein